MHHWPNILLTWRKGNIYGFIFNFIVLCHAMLFVKQMIMMVDRAVESLDRRIRYAWPSAVGTDSTLVWTRQKNLLSCVRKPRIGIRTSQKSERLSPLAYHARPSTLEWTLLNSYRRGSKLVKILDLAIYLDLAIDIDHIRWALRGAKRTVNQRCTETEMLKLGNVM